MVIREGFVRSRGGRGWRGGALAGGRLMQDHVPRGAGLLLRLGADRESGPAPSPLVHAPHLKLSQGSLFGDIFVIKVFGTIPNR